MKDCEVCNNGKNLTFTITSNGPLHKSFKEVDDPDGKSHTASICSVCGRKRYWVEETNRGTKMQIGLTEEEKLQNKKELHRNLIKVAIGFVLLVGITLLIFG